VSHPGIHAGAMIDDASIRSLAARQHGLVATRQVIELGFDKWQRRRLLDERRWERRSSGVWGLAGSPSTQAQRAMALVLGAGPGAALGAESAGAWWGIPGNALLPGHIDRWRNGAQSTAGGAAHEPTLLPDHHVVVLEDVPVVVPARALFDIAGSKRGGAELPWWIARMARMVDNAWSLRLVSGESMHAMLAEMAQRGRPGIRVMRAVLEDRGLDYIPPASALESRLVQIMQREGLPEFRRQVNVGDGMRWIGRVDFKDPVLPLILEVQSERFHASLIDRQLDATRIEGLRASGFVVVELTDTEVWLRREVVVAKIIEGRRAAVLLRRGAA
jgi:very-short-patch-repair endonuclease